MTTQTGEQAVYLTEAQLDEHTARLRALRESGYMCERCGKRPAADAYFICKACLKEQRQG